MESDEKEEVLGMINELEREAFNKIENGLIRSFFGGAFFGFAWVELMAEGSWLCIPLFGLSVFVYLWARRTALVDMCVEELPEEE